MRKCAPTSGHLPNKSQKDPWILTLDVGTSSVRTLIFDAQGRQAEEFGSQIPYHVASTSDGGFEVEADHLVELCVETLSRIHSHLSEVGIRPGAVAICTFWHSLVGVGADDRAPGGDIAVTTPLCASLRARCTRGRVASCIRATCRPSCYGFQKRARRLIAPRAGGCHSANICF